MRSFRHIPVPAVSTALTLLAACGDQPVAPLHDREQIISIERHEGDQQIGTVAMALPTRMTARVEDVDGRPKPGVAVTFSVIEGGGWVENPEEMLTDAQGLVSTVWYMGPRPGSAILVAQMAGGGSTGFRASATALEAGASYVGTDGLVELSVGSLPVILAAPHGGTLTPSNAPVVDDAGAPEAHTAELAFAIEDALGAQVGNRPTVLVSHLERTRAELDGPEPTTALALRTWRQYHGMLTAARLRLQEPHERGLIVDIHSHQSSDSIRDVARGQPSFARVVRGETSLGGLLSAHGVPVVPSPAVPVPDADYPASTFATERYGSKDGSLVSAVVLQVPAGIRDSEAQRSAFAVAFADALDRYFASYLGGALASH